MLWLLADPRVAPAKEIIWGLVKNEGNLGRNPRLSGGDLHFNQIPSPLLLWRQL